ncbi:hypothetical protein ACTFIR_002017 [Dictyostelium discoideum]
MKKIILIFLIIIIFNIQLFYCRPLCLQGGTDIGLNNDIRKWYIYQLPEEGGIYYWNSFSDTITEKIGIKYSLRYDSESAFLLTFNQMENPDYNYVTYNDHPDETRDKDPVGGHSKGFFIWNKDGGIHVMHSITAFPLFRTSRNDKTMEKGNFAKKPQTDGFNPGLEVFNHKNKFMKDKVPKSQQAQYAYCYPISKKEIDDGLIYRHLVLTNSIIGYVNGLAVNWGLSSLEVSNILDDLDPAKFPRVSFQRIDNTDEFQKRNIFYESVNIQLSQITTGIINEINKLNQNDKFPLFVLAKHAYYFSQYSKKQHLTTLYTQDSENFYVYQKQYSIIEKQLGKNYITGVRRFMQPSKLSANDLINIWTYISTLKMNFRGQQISLLGNFYLQTQNYYDYETGKVADLVRNVNQVDHLKGENIIITRKKDHSKQAFSVIEFKRDHPDEVVPTQPNQYDYKWFCVGDNNFMVKQAQRGGSVHCFKSPTLCKFFSKKVYSHYYISPSGEMKYYNQNIKEYINDFISRLVIKENSDDMERINTVQQHYQLTGTPMTFPPPPDKIDLYAEINGGGKIDFKTFQGFLIEKNNNYYLEAPTQFCWESNYYYPHIVFCKDENNCDNYQTEYLCTEKNKAMSYYYEINGDENQQTTRFSLDGIEALVDPLGQEDGYSMFETDVALRMILGNIYDSKNKVYFFINNKLLTQEFKTYKDVIDFCGKDIIIDQKVVTVNHIYNHGSKLPCMDLYKYCQEFREGVLLTDVGDVNLFNCRDFDYVGESWNKILTDENKISKGSKRDQIYNYRIIKK